MKKPITIAFILLFLITGINAQNDALPYATLESGLLRNNAAMMWDSALVNHFEVFTGRIQIATDQLQHGYNHLGTDMHDGWKLYLITVASGDRMAVSGFALQNLNGSINILEASDAAIGVEVFDRNARQFSHPDLSLKISYAAIDPSEKEALLPAYEF